MKPLILIADDDRVFADVLARFLESHGLETEIVTDGMHASMRALRKPKPSIIFLDIRMPAGSGLEVLKRIRMSNKTSGIPIVMVTADTSSKLPDEVHALGATEFAQKPVELEAIRRLVFKLLGWQEKDPAAAGKSA